jgi:hypothetical protein
MATEITRRRLVRKTVLAPAGVAAAIGTIGQAAPQGGDRSAHKESAAKEAGPKGKIGNNDLSFQISENVQIAKEARGNV